ncbi:MAG TPA: flagellar export chaperone FliS [Pusillimonas sp.]|nr:flagellar export chaperone FliS [Pusillimonas sp.]|tara:strand:- start:74543 stop:74977 length:435 start_codon:yes stop_codon:yes gene_type:complete
MTYSFARGPRATRSANTYASIDLETKVMSASPERLITLLYDGALAAMAKARLYMQNDNATGRGKAISKAIEIVDCGLKASVNQEVGGEVAKNMVFTYELITRNLLLANLNADMARLEAAEKALSEIADAWRSAVDVKKPAAVAS